VSVLFNGELALEQFKKRRAANAQVKQIDNSSLPAGSLMYYYCKHCRASTATLPEGHLGGAPTVCEPCKALVAHGLLPIPPEKVTALDKVGEALDKP
jgi:hypothetical protein